MRHWNTRKSSHGPITIFQHFSLRNVRKKSRVEKSQNSCLVQSIWKILFFMFIIAFLPAFIFTQFYLTYIKKNIYNNAETLNNKEMLNERIGENDNVVTGGPSWRTSRVATIWHTGDSGTWHNHLARKSQTINLDGNNM